MRSVHLHTECLIILNSDYSTFLNICFQNILEIPSIIVSLRAVTSGVPPTGLSLFIVFLHLTEFCLHVSEQLLLLHRKHSSGKLAGYTVHHSSFSGRERYEIDVI